MENEDNAQSYDEVNSDDGQMTQMESTIEESGQNKDANKIKNCAKSPDNQDQSQLKGFSVDAENRIVCLDCDKVFSLKSSYNIHKRM